ncbi:unnamed protein product, partial [Brassica rapa subsp. trilocularis]
RPFTLHHLHAANRVRLLPLGPIPKKISSAFSHTVHGVSRDLDDYHRYEEYLFFCLHLRRLAFYSTQPKPFSLQIQHHYHLLNSIPT